MQKNSSDTWAEWLDSYKKQFEELYGIDPRLPLSQKALLQTLIASGVGAGIGAVRGGLWPGHQEEVLDKKQNIVKKKPNSALSGALTGGLIGAGSSAIANYAGQTVSEYKPELNKLLTGVLNGLSGSTKTSKLKTTDLLGDSTMKKQSKVYDASESVENMPIKKTKMNHKCCTPGEFGARVKQARGQSYASNPGGSTPKTNAAAMAADPGYWAHFKAFYGPMLSRFGGDPVRTRSSRVKRDGGGRPDPRPTTEPLDQSGAGQSSAPNLGDMTLGGGIAGGGAGALLGAVLSKKKNKLRNALLGGALGAGAGALGGHYLGKMADAIKSAANPPQMPSMSAGPSRGPRGQDFLKNLSRPVAQARRATAGFSTAAPIIGKNVGRTVGGPLGAMAGQLGGMALGQQIAHEEGNIATSLGANPGQKVPFGFDFNRGVITNRPSAGAVQNAIDTQQARQWFDNEVASPQWRQKGSADKHGAASGDQYNQRIALKKKKYLNGLIDGTTTRVLAAGENPGADEELALGKNVGGWGLSTYLSPEEHKKLYGAKEEKEAASTLEDVGKMAAAKAAGSVSEYLGHFNPLNMYGGGLVGGGAALLTPTRSMKRQAEFDANDGVLRALGNVLIPGMGPYNMYKRIGAVTRSPEMKQRKARLEQEEAQKKLDALKPAETPEKEAGVYSEAFGSVLNPLSVLSAYPAGALAALTRTRTLDEQAKADRETWKNFLIPGRATYNSWKRLGAGARAPEHAQQVADIKLKKLQEQAGVSSNKPQDEEKEAASTLEDVSSYISGLYNKIPEPVRQGAGMGGVAGAALGGLSGLVAPGSKTEIGPDGKPVKKTRSRLMSAIQRAALGGVAGGSGGAAMGHFNPQLVSDMNEKYHTTANDIYYKHLFPQPKPKQVSFNWHELPQGLDAETYAGHA